jgi:hypothetical protein
LSGSPPRTLQDGLGTLREIRKAIYEDLNQVQHECLILEAANWLTANQHTSSNAVWYWNPRQTGDASEPDLSAKRRGVQLVAAEVTTSERPVGVIDRRMAQTLKKLAAMRGSRFYFVRTPEMKTRAETKVRRHGWPITVVLIDNLVRSNQRLQLTARAFKRNG